MALTPVRLLNRAAIRVQLPLVLLVIPVTAALLGIGLIPVIHDLYSASGAGAADARVALRVAVAILVGGVLVSTLGASLLLRGPIRAVVEQMEAATTAIADGDFRHRVRTTRRDELGGLGRSIDVMAARLERLEQARRRLLASVSHELRTPLTIIRRHAYSLGESEQDRVRRDRLQLVEYETIRLASLIDDLVQASALDAGGVRLQLERADLGELVRRAHARFVDRAHELGVVLEVNGLSRGQCPVDVDVTRAEQMLANLLDNAVRHAPCGSVVRLWMGAGAGRERTVSVEIIGHIDPRVASSIFERFIQGSERAGRVGLGLAIIQGLAAAHGGRLSLASDGSENGFVRFELALRLQHVLRTRCDVYAVHVSRPCSDLVPR